MHPALAELLPTTPQSPPGWRAEGRLAVGDGAFPPTARAGMPRRGTRFAPAMTKPLARMNPRSRAYHTWATETLPASPTGPVNQSSPGIWKRSRVLAAGCAPAPSQQPLSQNLPQELGRRLGWAMGCATPSAPCVTGRQTKPLRCGDIPLPPREASGDPHSATLIAHVDLKLRFCSLPINEPQPEHLLRGLCSALSPRLEREAADGSAAGFIPGR